MSNNASPVPSELRRHGRWLAEIALVLLLMAAFSLWLNRHMLDSGEPAPAETLPALPAGTGTLHWPAQHDKTLVYFFAPWCAVCKVSMPSLNLLSGDDLRVVVIALDWQNQAEVEAFVHSSDFQGEVLLGTAGTMQRWQIDAFPSYYVVGRDGKVLHRDRGFTTPPGLLLRIR